MILPAPRPAQPGRSHGSAVGDPRLLLRLRMRGAWQPDALKKDDA